MKNYIQLEVGGKVRGLKFNMATMEYVQQITGEDPLTFRAVSSSFQDVYKYALVLFHAGLLSNCDSKGEEPDFTDDDVKKWFRSLDEDDVNILISRGKEPKAVATREDGKDTQQVANLDRA